MTDPAVHDVLVRSRNYIDARGWQPRACSPSNEIRPGACAGLAIAEFGGDDFRLSPLARSATYAFGAAAGLHHISPAAVYNWNDAPGRTKEQVLAAFDRAIAETAPEPPDPLDRFTEACVVIDSLLPDELVQA